MNNKNNKSGNRAGPEHFKHAVILLLLWIPVAIFEIVLFKNHSEDKFLLLAVVSISITLLALFIWKLFLHFKQ